MNSHTFLLLNVCIRCRMLVFPPIGVVAFSTQNRPPDVRETSRGSLLWALLHVNHRQRFAIRQRNGDWLHRDVAIGPE